ncbi:MAG: hypothetical protein EVA35_01830 [Candidatus Poseidoniales archaeon]|nr:MAG: hypothetical protein EVA35_01830 [Candidatus Poseidoniales archaeon]
MKCSKYHYYLICLDRSMSQSSRATQLSLLLVMLLIGMSLNSVLSPWNSSELSKEDTKQQTHANASTLFYPGSQEGSTYSYSTISASQDSTCAVAEDHSMRCWGRDDYMQLGRIQWNGQNMYQPTNVSLTSNGYSSSALEVSAYGNHACALMSDERIKCWGDSTYGQLGTSGGSSLPDVTNFWSTSSMATQVSLGRNHTCAILVDQSVWCWGDNNWAQMGQGYLSNAPFWSPSQVPQIGSTSIAVSAGAEHSCAILMNGSAYCWGWLTYGKLGDGGLSSTVGSPSWVAVLPQNRTVAAISAGHHNTCAILDDGTVRCWGLNNYGQYGDGTTTTQLTSSGEALLPSGKTAIAIDVGAYHVCAILNDDSTYCWGKNDYGQLGVGSTVSFHTTPTQVNVPNGITFSTISTGYDHTCAISSDASAYCWGDNSHGELGDGTSVDRNSPVEINLGPSCIGCSEPDQNPQLGERDPDGDGILSIFDASPYIAACTPGYFAQNNTSGCTPTDPGYYSGADMFYQIPCPAGTYQPNSAQTSCLEVAPGHYAEVNISATFQIPCPAGTYSPNSGSVGYSCTPVEPGNYSSAGSPQPVPCPSGTLQPLAAQASCIAADPGHFVQFSMQTQQEACLPGTYQPISGQTTCWTATQGFYAAGTGSTEQTQCSPGTYSTSPGAVSCMVADQGHYASAGAAEQIACDPGFYQNMMGMADCIGTNPGHYTDQPGSINELECPEGTYQPDREATSCIETDPGHFSDSASVSQTMCEAGTFADSGMSQCTLADAGYFVSQSGASAQEACPAGTHQPSSGQSSCVDNEPGYYTAEEGTPSQMACPLGTYQDAAMATSCMEAESGYHVPAPGSSEQAACLAGTYQPSTGQTECIPSEAGHYVISAAATFSTPCEVRTFQPEQGQTGCIDAQPGNIAPEVGMAAQVPCDRGTYQSLSAQTECIDTEPGYITPTSAALHPTPCSPGTYQDSSGEMYCKMADVNHYVAESAATSQSKCTDGATQPLRGQASCIEADNSMLIMGGAAALVVIALTAMYTNSQKKGQAPKRPPEARKRRRRPPKGKR